MRTRDFNVPAHLHHQFMLRIEKENHLSRTYSQTDNSRENHCLIPTDITSPLNAMLATETRGDEQKKDDLPKKKKTQICKYSRREGRRQPKTFFPSTRVRPISYPFRNHKHPSRYVSCVTTSVMFSPAQKKKRNPMLKNGCYAFFSSLPSPIEKEEMKRFSRLFLAPSRQ